MIGAVEVVRIEDSGANGVRCALDVPGSPGLVVTADVTRREARLIVTQVWVAQDGSVTSGVEIDRAAWRAIDPAAIVRALADFAADRADPALRAWFAGNREGLATVAAAERVQSWRDAGATPTRRGRPAKFTLAEYLHWTRRALALDAERPKSLHAALAGEMSSSGRADLVHSTSANARDLLHDLRRRGYLQPARRGGAREPLAPGPNYPMEEQP